MLVYYFLRVLQMYIWKRALKQAYPYIDNKDIDMVLEINKPRVYEQYVMVNWKGRPQHLYIKKDIEQIFWTIEKTTI